jgi:hypothetical protein
MGSMASCPEAMASCTACSLAPNEGASTEACAAPGAKAIAKPIDIKAMQREFGFETSDIVSLL